MDYLGLSINLFNFWFTGQANVIRSTLSKILFEIGLESSFDQHLRSKIVVEIQIVATKLISIAEKGRKLQNQLILIKNG